MPLSAGYVSRETATNLSRNGLMSVAAIVTIAVLGGLHWIRVFHQ